MADNGKNAGFEVLISSDSHVMEPADTLKERVAPAFRDQAPEFPRLKVGESFQTHPGGSDPSYRIKEMETDGVSAEVLYPTYLLPHFAMDDAKLQEACFRAYNDWLVDYCSVSPKRLIGIAAISVYEIDQAVKELERCAKAGLKGSIIWQAPHPDLPFKSDHYNKFWAASQDLNMPVNLHILTGHGYHKETVFGKNRRKGVESYRGSVNLKLQEIINAVFELIFYGIMERYPKLKFVTVENEIGWMPFMLQQWDYYYNRFKKENPPPISKNPSEYFQNQVYGTFFRDTVAGHFFDWWGQDNCMWSNDYPHGNSTWPESRKYIDRDLGHLRPAVRKKLVCTNVAKLYDMGVPSLSN
jgi:predicted TIM-barrel fold metal-dependent hydrolase